MASWVVMLFQALEMIYHAERWQDPTVPAGEKSLFEWELPTCPEDPPKNVQTGSWADTAEEDVGMVWWSRRGPGSRMNEGRQAGDRPHAIQYARPSSNHPGGAGAFFCDGHYRFLTDGMDYNVYQHIMTPDSGEAGVSGKFDPEDL